MAGESTLAALLDVHAQLRQMPEWREVAAEIDAAIGQYQTTSDPESQARIATTIRRLLRRQARDAYDVLMAKITELEGDAHTTTRGVPPHSQIVNRIQEINHQGALVLGVHAQEAPRLRRYTDISCPRQVWIEERLTITVALTIDRPDQSVAIKELILRQEQPIKVRVAALRFDLLSPVEQEIALSWSAGLYRATIYRSRLASPGQRRHALREAH